MAKRRRQNSNSGKPEDKQRNNFRKDKKVEVNVNDSDINSADLRPMEKRSRSKNHDNDYTWYNHYAQQFDTVSGFQYGKPLGSPINYKFIPNVTLDDKSLQINSQQRVVPGIMTLHYVPTFGAARGGYYASPLNKVGDQIYQVMRMELGSRADYDETDTVLFLVSMDSAYMMFYLGMKIYGTLRMSSPENYYYMRVLTRSMGVDFESFSANMADFRNWLNQYAIYLSSYSVPADFDLYKRHVWLLQNIFMDSATPKAQAYHYMPDGYYTYVEVTDGPAYCQFNPMLFDTTDSNSTPLISYSSFKTMCTEILNALQTSNDISQMSADIAKAFAGNTYLLQLVPEDYQVPVSFSQEVLSQIENTILYGDPAIVEYTSADDTKNTSWNIYQNVNLSLGNKGPALVQIAATNPLQVNSNLAVGALYALSKQNYVVNMHTTQIEQKDNFVATRGICNCTVQEFNLLSDPATVTCLDIDSYGSEIFTRAEMFTLVPGNITNPLNIIVQPFCSIVANAGSSLLLQNWETFDWSPHLELVTVSSTSQLTTVNVYRYQDLDYYAVIDTDQVDAMNTTAVLSLFWSSKFPTVEGSK